MRSATEVVREWITDTGNRFHSHAQSLPEPITCDTCTAHGCCKQKVAVDVGEAMVIAEKLMSELSKAALAGFMLLLEEEADLMDQYSRDEWFNQNRTCAFLNKISGKCSIYEVRPLACRLHLVVSPAEDCDHPSNKKILKVNSRPVEAEQFKFSRHIHAELGLKETEMRMFAEFLPRMVYRVLRATIRSEGQHGFAKEMRSFKWPTSADIIEGREAKWQ